MNFTPVNRNLLVELIKNEQETDVGVLLPSDYRPAEKPYIPVRLLKSSPLSERFSDHVGGVLIVEAHMIREIQFDNNVFHTIGENYVVGTISD